MNSSLTSSKTATGHAPVLTTESVHGGNVDVVDANVDVVNAMYAELLDAAEIAPNALRSYYVDFYLTQALGGGFAQYVFTLPEREEIDSYVREGLAAMGAAAHLDLFNRSVAAYDSLSESEADAYLDGDAELSLAGDTAAAVPEAVRLLEQLDDAFEPLLETEDLVALNAAWLRSQPGLLVLDADELDRHIHERVSRIPNLAERQAEAADEELRSAPEFELIIRELCEVAGHTLQKITMGDPNHVHDGERVLAWHFTTDQGEYLMLEDDGEAYMIHPATREIVAALEFEDDSDDEPAAGL